MEIQKTPQGQNTIQKENRVGGITLPNFILYYKAMVIKTCYWLNRHTDQWKRMENSESYTSGQLINEKRGKNRQWRKDSLQKVVLGKLDRYR